MFGLNRPYTLASTEADQERTDASAEATPLRQTFVADDPSERPGQLKSDAAAEVTLQDLAGAQAFWAFWGTPFFRALLDAKPESRRDRGKGPLAGSIPQR